MRLKVISSGSIGNCYILENDNSALLIESGIKFSEIKEALNFDVMKLKGCVLTHEHGDHSKSVSQVMQLGVPIVSSKGTFEALRIDEYRGNVILSHGQTTKIGEFTISALNVEHDAKEPLAFLIEHVDCGRVLFITDTFIFRYKIPSVDHLIIEANYCEDLIQREREKRGIDFINKRRYKTHMSIQTACETINRMDKSSMKNIVLIHLSDNTSNERGFQEIVESQFGIKTTVATKGQIINFSKDFF